MSCTTDRPGSVLMEFLLVLPIYLVLLGMVFAVGEMGVKALSLALGDRIGAHAVVAGDKSAWQLLLQRVFAVNGENLITWTDDVSEAGHVDSLSRESAVWVPDADAPGPWYAMGAATAEDSYALPPWTRGWLQYADDRFRRTTGDRSNADGALSDLIRMGSLVRVPIRSKDWDVSRTRAYNYYTLVRTPQGRASYHAWSAGNLARVSAMPVGSSTWFSNVFAEKSVYGNESLVSSAVSALGLSDDGAQALDGGPVSIASGEPDPGKRSEYSRSVALQAVSR